MIQSQLREERKKETSNSLELCGNHTLIITLPYHYRCYWQLNPQTQLQGIAIREVNGLSYACDQHIHIHYHLSTYSCTQHSLAQGPYFLRLVRPIPQGARKYALIQAHKLESRQREKRNRISVPITAATFLCIELYKRKQCRPSRQLVQVYTVSPQHKAHLDLLVPHTLHHHYQSAIILVNFSLSVSTLTVKFNSLSNFPATWSMSKVGHHLKSC